MTARQLFPFVALRNLYVGDVDPNGVGNALQLAYATGDFVDVDVVRALGFEVGKDVEFRPGFEPKVLKAAEAKEKTPVAKAAGLSEKSSSKDASK